jgi:hypothetical protein
MLLFFFCILHCALTKALSLPFDKLSMHGSMVLRILAVYLFALTERNKDAQKEIKYRCE